MPPIGFRTGRAPDLETVIVATRHEYGSGAKQLRQVLCTRYPKRPWPPRSPFNEILDRHGLLRKHRRRRRWKHPGAAPLHTERPNQVWPVDFKGQFKTGDGRSCYPLTVTDHFSRSLLACHGLRSVATAEVKPVFRTLFRGVAF